jgi:crotonobetainyl-CoA:carnitine CoA-transferase CaiB-like acyl-CoA transferase
VAITDVVTGLYAGVAVLACLPARQSTGHGYAIDLALLDCAVASQVNVPQVFLSSGVTPSRQGNAHLQIVPYQLFATADGWLVLAVGNDNQWQRFCAAAGRADLAGDERYRLNADRVRSRGVLVPSLETLMRERTTVAWQEALGKAEVPHAPLWDYGELFSSEQAKARGLKVEVRDAQGRPVDLLASPFRIGGTTLPETRIPPGLGDHTDVVLGEVLGFDRARLDELRRGGVI